MKMTLQHHHEPHSHNETHFVIVVSSSFLRLITSRNLHKLRRSQCVCIRSNYLLKKMELTEILSLVITA